MPSCERLFTVSQTTVPSAHPTVLERASVPHDPMTDATPRPNDRLDASIQSPTRRNDPITDSNGQTIHEPLDHT